MFVGPGACTTNDDTMSRHGPEYALRGATLRRACRVGGGTVLCPGVEVGEEAFVAAGAVVDARRAAARRGDGRARARDAGGRRRRPARALALTAATSRSQQTAATVRAHEHRPRHDLRRPARAALRLIPSRRLKASRRATSPACRHGEGYSSPPPPGAVGGRAGSPTPAVPSAGRYALATWWSRVGAALIDGLIIFVGGS